MVLAADLRTSSQDDYFACSSHSEDSRRLHSRY